MTAFIPKVRTIQLLLRAHLDDGYVCEGSTRVVPNSIVEEMDSIFFAEMDFVLPPLEQKDIRTLDDIYLNVLIERLKKLTIATLDEDGNPITDLIELCKRRLQLNIKAKNFVTKTYLLPAPNLSEPVVEEPMKNKDIHVVPNKDGGWDVQEAGNPTPIDHKSTKKEAVAAGRELAKAAKVELVIHNKNGKISDKDTFGHESKVKDKKH